LGEGKGLTLPNAEKKGGEFRAGTITNTSLSKYPGTGINKKKLVARTRPRPNTKQEDKVVQRSTGSKKIRERGRLMTGVNNAHKKKKRKAD